MTTEEFVRRLDQLPKPTPMGRIFALAKDCIDMEPDEIERLLENPRHEARVGAVSVIDGGRVVAARARNGGASCSTCTSAATT